jgi:hypothetical protein
MGWKDWENPQFAGYRASRSVLGFTVREKDVSDADIDRELRRGKNPRSTLGRKIRQMPPRDQKKVGRRIAARERKRSQ